MLALLAGLSTTIGSFIAFIFSKPSPKIICIIMGFSAGVMILISFVELLQEGIDSTTLLLGVIFFILGMVIMLIIDVFISHSYEFEEGSYEESPNNAKKSITQKNLEIQKTSLLITLGIMIHNLPEGMATFVGTLKSLDLGILLALAIALHNIPEGIAVSVPIYSSTGSKKKAFFWSFLSGISEFIGALLCGLFLYPFINEFILGAMLAIVGGFMIYISLDELLPVSRSYGNEHLSIIGMMIGMLIMGLSLTIL
ncbi:MAG: Zinc transporter ZupT [Promethearchaeota archaeon]|nr:MAG: Zinc transporter ZupT [Candidatus Lokiarchaeota archaeon]